MSRDEEVGEVVSGIISLVNNQYSFLVELLRVLMWCMREKGWGCYCLWALTSKCTMGRRKAGGHYLVSG